MSDSEEPQDKPQNLPQNLPQKQLQDQPQMQPQEQLQDQPQDQPPENQQEQQQQPTDYDVLVIGAGISGLAAASELLRLRPDCRVAVVEAKDRVGGRTLGHRMRTAGGEEADFDLGGMWIGPSQRHITELMHQLQIEQYPQYLAGRKCAEMGAKVAQYNGEIPYIGLFGLLDMGKVLVQVERRVRQVNAADPGACRNAAQLDGVTGQALLNSLSWSHATKCLVQAAARTIWGADLGRMSALYMLAYASAAGGFQALVASDAQSGQGFRMKGGAHQVCQRLADRLGPQRVLLSAPVAAIRQLDDHVCLDIVERSVPLTARYAVSTAPPHLLAHLDWQPPLPARKLDLYRCSPVGHIFKFIITYETAFWRDLGYSGEIVSAEGPPTAPGLTSAPISVCFDYSQEEGRHPALVVLSGGLQAQELDALTPEQRRVAVLNHISRFFPSDRVHACLDFAEKNWRHEPYNGGCPVNIVSAGAAHLMGPNMRAPFGRVHFAGTETATEWCGFMDGAVQSGNRAAGEVAKRLGGK